MQDQPINPPPICRDARIVILTGAGISQESGLETFRDPEGIWSQVRVEDVATPEAFARDPEKVLAFYNMRRARHRNSTVAPNPGHEALARLEQDWPGDVLIVTQNLDSLHERAGSANVIHMHGGHTKAQCNGCGHVVPWEGDLLITDVCENCDRSGGLRPHVVWFGETPLAMDRIQDALSMCDLFISIGTSGNVYPAAGFVAFVRHLGQAHTVELNLEPSHGATQFAEAHYGPATQVAPAYVDLLLNQN